MDALVNHGIAGAAIDVYDAEPLRGNHTYRRADNLLATPHIGYVSRGLYERFYQDSVNNISAWLDERLLSTTKDKSPRLTLFNKQGSNSHE